MSFWSEIGESLKQGAVGLTDTAASGLRLAAQDKIAQKIARSGGESRYRAESVQPANLVYPATGEVKAAQISAGQDFRGFPIHYLMMGGGLLAIAMIARRSR